MSLNKIPSIQEGLVAHLKPYIAAQDQMAKLVSPLDNIQKQISGLNVGDKISQNMMDDCPTIK